MSLHTPSDHVAPKGAQEDFFEIVGLENTSPLHRIAIAVGVGALLVFTPYSGNAQEQKRDGETPLQRTEVIDVTRRQIVHQVHLSVVRGRIIAQYVDCFRKNGEEDICVPRKGNQPPVAGTIELLTRDTPQLTIASTQR